MAAMSAAEQPRARPVDPTTFTETTFRAYSATAAEAYLAGRPPYPSKLIEIILQHHESTGGQTDVLVDVGCGPGTATRTLSPFFHTAHGVDPSPGMLETARSIPSTTRSGNPVTFTVGPAEELDKILFPSPNHGADATPSPLPPGSVDMITAATAAHWFDMRPFFASAAHLLKPNGTLAIWAGGNYYCHPTTTPNAAQVQDILIDLEHNILAPYKTPNNHLCANLYDDLRLPWTCDPPVAAFDRDAFVRREWNRDGKLEPGESGFFRGQKQFSMDDFARGCATASTVTRWREANREKVERGEMEDCVELTMRKVREATGGKERLDGGMSTVLLLFKKKG